VGSAIIAAVIVTGSIDAGKIRRAGVQRPEIRDGHPTLYGLNILWTRQFKTPELSECVRYGRNHCMLRRISACYGRNHVTAGMLR